jgi:hypothetical protein
LRELPSFGFAVEASAFGNLNQILIVGSAMNFGLRGAEFLLFVLHGDFSENTGDGDRIPADRVD